MRYLLPLVLLLLMTACQPEPAPAEEESMEHDAMDGAAMEKIEEPEEEEEAMEEPKVEEKKSGGASALKSLFTKKKTVSYMVTYDMDTTTNGQRQTMTMKQYIKSEDKMRFDMDVQGIESRTILDGDSFYSCTKPEGSWSCFTAEYTKSESETMQHEIEENVDSYDVRELPSRTIAATRAECFGIVAPTGSVEYCLSSEGVPLYIKSEGSSDGTSFTSEMVATEYSTTVPNSAFDLPAEPLDLGNIGDDPEAYRDFLAAYS